MLIFFFVIYWLIYLQKFEIKFFFFFNLIPVIWRYPTIISWACALQEIRPSLDSFLFLFHTNSKTPTSTFGRPAAEKMQTNNWRFRHSFVWRRRQQVYRWKALPISSRRAEDPSLVLMLMMHNMRKTGVNDK